MGAGRSLGGVNPTTTNSKMGEDRRMPVTFLLMVALASVIPSLLLVAKLTNNPAVEDFYVGVADVMDAPRTDKSTTNAVKGGNTSAVNHLGIAKAADEGTPNKPPVQFTSWPGFTKESIVVCGGHKAPSCDKCPQGNGASWCNGECEWKAGECVRSSKLAHLHPDYFRITDRYAFQQVMNQNREFVNVIMVRSPFRGKSDETLYHFYKDQILFLGISSFESYPLQTPNPYSAKTIEDDYYLKMFPGFLHMMREPSQHFPSNVSTILMSQSDFELDSPMKFGQEHAQDEKIYDFVYSGGDQDVESDCVGWASYNKNFSFVREALEVMCSPEFNVTGVLVANKNKANTKACTIPASCKDNIVQTTFLEQGKFFQYLSKARWAFLPQICDASPRVSTQALSMNVPLLMNRNIMGGWKYMREGETGEFFHDMSDFKQSLRRILDNTRGKSSPYKPLEFVKKNYGNTNSGVRLYEFVKKNFGHRIQLPKGTKMLIPTGA